MPPSQMHFKNVCCSVLLHDMFHPYLLGQSLKKTAVYDPCLDQAVEVLHPLFPPTLDKPVNTHFHLENPLQITKRLIMSYLDSVVAVQIVTCVFLGD